MKTKPKHSTNNSYAWSVQIRLKPLFTPAYKDYWLITSVRKLHELRVGQAFLRVSHDSLSQALRSKTASGPKQNTTFNVNSDKLEQNSHVIALHLN